MKALEDFLADRPVDRQRVDTYKERMLARVSAYRNGRDEEDGQETSGRPDDIEDEQGGTGDEAQ